MHLFNFGMSLIASFCMEAVPGAEELQLGIVTDSKSN